MKTSISSWVIVLDYVDYITITRTEWKTSVWELSDDYSFFRLY